jgi:hypothetical protein
MRAHEDFMPWSALRPILERLWDACEQLDYEKARTTLLEAVAGYAPTEGVGDLVWQERNRNLARKAVIGNVTPLESRRGTSSGEQRGT